MKVFQKEIFLIEGFSTPYRLDRDCKGGGSCYMEEQIYPLTFLRLKINLSRAFLLSLTCKILINCSYNPHTSEIKKHLTALGNSLDLYSSKYEKILILGDFNVEIEEANIKSFCENYNQ